MTGLRVAALALLLAAALASHGHAQDDGDQASEDTGALYDDAGTGDASDESFDDSAVDPYADSGYADDGAEDAADDGSGVVIEDGYGEFDEGLADVEGDAADAGTGGGPAASAAVLRGEALLDWARALPASRLDARLPPLPLDTWLRTQAGGAYPPMWSVSDCGEQSGDPEVDAGRDIPACAMADGLDARGKGYEIVILGETAGGEILYNAAILRGVEATIAGELTVEPLLLLGDLPHALEE